MLVEQVCGVVQLRAGHPKALLFAELGSLAK